MLNEVALSQDTAKTPLCPHHYRPLKVKLITVRNETAEILRILAETLAQNKGLPSVNESRCQRSSPLQAGD